MLTGESLPVFKEHGHSVSAGTVNWVCSFMKLYTNFSELCLNLEQKARCCKILHVIDIFL